MTQRKLVVAKALKEVGLRVIRVDQMSSAGNLIPKCAIDFTREDGFDYTRLSRTPQIDFGLGDQHVAKVKYNGKFTASFGLCNVCYKPREEMHTAPASVGGVPLVGYTPAYVGARAPSDYWCAGHGGTSRMNTSSTESKKRKATAVEKEQADKLAHAAAASSSADPFFG